MTVRDEMYLQNIFVKIRNILKHAMSCHVSKVPVKNIAHNNPFDHVEDVIVTQNFDTNIVKAAGGITQTFNNSLLTLFANTCSR